MLVHPIPMPVDADLNLVLNGVRTTSFIGAVTQVGVEFFGMSVSVTEDNW